MSFAQILPVPVQIGRQGPVTMYYMLCEIQISRVNMQSFWTLESSFMCLPCSELACWMLVFLEKWERFVFSELHAHMAFTSILRNPLIFTWRFCCHCVDGNTPFFCSRKLRSLWIFLIIPHNVMQVLSGYLRGLPDLLQNTSLHFSYTISWSWKYSVVIAKSQ